MISQFKKMKFIKLIKNILKLIFYRLKLLISLSKNKKTKIIYIVEGENWSIKWDGEYISKAINQNQKSRLISTSHIPYVNEKNKVIHFGSQYMWVDWYKLLPKNKNYVVSFFHGNRNCFHGSYPSSAN